MSDIPEVPVPMRKLYQTGAAGFKKPFWSCYDSLRWYGRYYGILRGSCIFAITAYSRSLAK